MPRYVFYVLYSLAALLFFVFMVISTMGTNYLLVRWILGLFGR